MTGKLQRQRIQQAYLQVRDPLQPLHDFNVRRDRYVLSSLTPEEQDNWNDEVEKKFEHLKTEFEQQHADELDHINDGIGQHLLFMRLSFGDEHFHRAKRCYEQVLDPEPGIPCDPKELQWHPFDLEGKRVVVPLRIITVLVVAARSTPLRGRMPVRPHGRERRAHRARAPGSAGGDDSDGGSDDDSDGLTDNSFSHVQRRTFAHVWRAAFAFSFARWGWRQ